MEDNKVNAFLGFILTLCVMVMLPAYGTTTYPNPVLYGSTGVPHKTAAIEIRSSTKGLLLPRMSTVQRLSIVTPPAGLCVYDTGFNSMYIFDGITWIASSASSLSVAGPISGLSTNKAIVRWDGATGNKIQDSGVLINDTNDISNVNKITVITDATIANLKLTGNTLGATNVDGSVILSPNGTGIISSNTTKAFMVPKGTQLERPLVPSNGLLRYNTTSNIFEGFIAGSWEPLGKEGGIPIYAVGVDTKTNHVVYDGATNKIYRATADFMTVDFATELAANKWVELSKDGRQVLKWVAGLSITPEDIVYEDASNKIYKSTNTFTTANFATELSAGDWVELSKAGKQFLKWVGGLSIEPEDVVYDDTTKKIYTSTASFVTSDFPTELAALKWVELSPLEKGKGILKYEAGLVIVPEMVVYDEVSKKVYVATDYLTTVDLAVEIIAGKWLELSPNEKDIQKWVVGLNAVTGMVVYDDTSKKIYVADGTFITTDFAVELAANNWIELSTGLAQIASATDNAITRWDGTTGKFVQNSTVLIDDLANITQVNNLEAAGKITIDNLSLENNEISASDTNGNINLKPNGTGGVVADASSFLKLPSGAIVNRPLIPSDGMIRFNTETGTFEGYKAGTWGKLGGGVSKYAVGMSLVTDDVVYEDVSKKIYQATASFTTVDFATELLAGQFVELSAGLEPIVLSTDEGILRWDGTTGKLVQDSSVTINDLHEVAGATKLTVDNIVVDGADVTTDQAALNLKADTNVTGTVTVQNNKLKVGSGGGATAQIALSNSTDTFSTILKSADVTANKLFTLPAVDGTNRQSLQTDGAGVLSFGDLAGTVVEWAPGRAYLLNDLVYDRSNKQLYRCITPHTSGASLLANVANWQLIRGGETSGEWKNFVYNPSGFYDTEGWVEVSATIMTNTTYKIEGIGSFALLPNNVDAAAFTTISAVDADLTGTCEASVSAQTISSKWNLELRDATTDAVLSNVDIGVSSGFQSYYLVYPCGPIRVRITADTGVNPNDPIYFGKVYWGKAKHITNVSQAQFWGSVRWIGTRYGNDNCNFDTALTNANQFYFTTPDVDCDDQLRDIKGTYNITSGAIGNSDGQLPQIKFSSIPGPGVLKCEAKGYLQVQAGSAVHAEYRFTDGTNFTSANTFWANSASVAMPSLIGEFNYTSPQSNITIQLQASSSLAGATEYLRVRNTYKDELEISCYFFPSSSQTAFTNDQSSWFVDANIGGANPSFGVNASYVELTNASLDLVNNTAKGSASDVKIACASGTASTGLTCSSNESVGICFTNPFAGVYECIATGATTNSNSENEILQLVETSDLSSVIIQEGGGKKSLSNVNASGVSGGFSLQGIFNFPDVKKRCVRLEYESSVAGGILQMDRSGTYGQRDLHISCRPFLQNVNPVLMSMIGVNQAWQDLSASRVANTVYTNTTQAPISVNVRFQSAGAGYTPYFQVNGVNVQCSGSSNNDGGYGICSVIVPKGHTYQFIPSGASISGNGWQELR